jgi:hypothetical protein
MSTIYGYPADQWERVKAEMRDILMDRARVRGMIPYSELVAQVKTMALQPESYALAAMLGEISRDEDAAGRGMLSVIVVHKSGDMQPGPDFFQLAKHLGRDTSDILTC